MNKLTEHELELFHKLTAQREQDCKVLNAKRYGALLQSKIDKYTESAHFVYELLQNADDAEATEAHFVLTKPYLIFKHNGSRQFDITDCEDEDPTHRVGDLNAIVSYGDSMKGEDEKNKIGKFGIGFKAVYQYTDEPEIYDDKFHFRIEKTIIPHLLDHDDSYRKPGETLFRLNFRDVEHGYERILKRLQNLSSPILFLNHLEKVVWEFEGRKKVYTKKVVEYISNKDGITFNLVTEQSSVGVNHILLFSRPFTTSDGRCHPIYIGYYLNSNKTGIDTKQLPHLFCFFQLGYKLDLPILAHAPFLTTDNRDGLLPDEEENNLLLAALGQLAADSLPLLRDYSKAKDKAYLSLNVFDLIPWKYYVASPSINDEKICTRSFFDAFTEVLSTNKLLLAEDGEYVNPSSAVMSQKIIRDLISLSQLSKLRLIKEPHFVRWDTSAIHQSYFQKELGGHIFTESDVIANLNARFMSAQSIEWVGKLYHFLKSDTIPCSHFMNAPIIPLEDGTWISLSRAKNKNVYLPFDKQVTENETSTNRYVAAVYVVQYKDFYEKKLELKQPEPFNYVRDVLIPKYGEARQKENIDEEDLILKQIVQKLKTLNSEQFSMLKSKLRFKAVGRKNRVEIDELKIIKDKDILNFYRDNANLKIVDIAYYKNLWTDMPPNAIDKFIDSLELTPVEKIIQDEEELRRSGRGHRNVRNAKILYWRNTYGVWEYVYRTLDREGSLFLWREVLRFYKEHNTRRLFTHYSQPSSAYYRWSAWEDHGESDLYDQLTTCRWICQADGTHVRPCDIYAADFHKLGYESCKEIEKELEFGKVLKEKEEEQRRREADEERRRAEQEKEESKDQMYETFGGNTEKALLAHEFLEAVGEEKVKEILANKERLQALTSSLNALDNEVSTSASTFSDLDGDKVEDDYFRSDFSYYSQISLPNNIRKTIHYIGVQLCYTLFKNKYGFATEQAEGGADYDLKVGTKLYAVSAVEQREFGKEPPIQLTKQQHSYIKQSGQNNVRIIRLSLRDLGIDLSTLKSIYGVDADIETNERLRNACDKLVSQYWSSTAKEDFERLCTKYLVKVYREE